MEEDGLKNPMRFSIRNRTIDLENYLQHPDFQNKNATELDIRPGEGQIYIHWELTDE